MTSISTENTQRMAMIAHLAKQVMDDPTTSPQLAKWAKQLQINVLTRMVTPDDVDTLDDITPAVDALQDMLDDAEGHDLDQDEGESIEAAITLLKMHGHYTEA